MKNKNPSVTRTGEITTLLDNLTQLILPWLQLEVVYRHDPHRPLDPHRDQEGNLSLDRQIQLLTLASDVLVDAEREGDAIVVDTVGKALRTLAEAAPAS